MTIKSLRDVELLEKRIDRHIGRLEKRMRNLRDRISYTTGAADPTAVQGGGGATLSGTVVAGTGLTGGGSLPGTVTLNVDQAYAFNWTVAHTHTADIRLDDGSGDSPYLKFVGGAHDDEITVKLVDDATAGRSDLGIYLADSAGYSRVLIYDSGLGTALQFTSLGDIYCRNVNPSGLVDGVDIANFNAMQFVVMSVSGYAANERRLVGGDGIDLNDGGAGGDVTLAVDLHGTWSGMEIASAKLRLDQDAAFTWTATHTFQQDIQLDANLDFIGAQTITTSADNLTIQPTGDLLIDPQGDQIKYANWGPGKSFESSDYQSQSVGFAIYYGDATTGGNADFRYIYADELHVKAFIADIYSALAGGLIITKSRARVSRDFTIPDTGNSATLYVEDHEGFEGYGVFIANDYVLLRVIDTSGGGLIVADVYGQVTSYTDLSGGEQSWTFTTTTAGYSASDEIYKGSVALDFGQIGSGSRGIWEATVLDPSSPYSQVKTWDTITSGEPTNFTVHVRVGNLDGIGGVGLEYGLWAGQNTTNKYLLVTDTSFELHGIAQTWYDGNDVIRGVVDPTATGSSTLFWLGPDTDNKRFTVSGDGDVWLSTLSISEDLGSWLFSQSDGLLLLDMQKIEHDGSNWNVIGSRGQKATLTGALHQEQGRWGGTRALVVEPYTKNYCTNPLMYDGNSNGTADDWAISENSGNVDTPTIEIHPVHGWLQRIQLTPAGGDSGKYLTFYHNTEAGTFAEGDDVTLSYDYESHSSGVRIRLRILAYSSGHANLGSWYGSDLQNERALTRVSFTKTSLPANTDYVRVYLSVVNIDAGDTLDVRVGRVNVEKDSVATSALAGSTGVNYAWTGTAHASQSTRTATTLNLDNLVGLISDNDTLSFRIVAQMPYNATATWGAAYPNLFEATGADSNNRIILRFDPATNKFRVYINGGWRIYPDDATFIARDQQDIVLTLDFGNDEYKLYVDGLLIGSDTTSLTRPTLTQWNLGSETDDTDIAGFVFSEFAVFDKVVTANEVASLHALQRPLVDAGSIEKPGVYILDGQFRIASSLTGQRVDIRPEGIGIFDDSGETSVARLLGGRVDMTGKVLDPAGDSLGWFGYDANDDLQVAWYGAGANAGAIEAGGGVVMLDAGGIAIETTTVYEGPRAYKFYRNATSTVLGGLYMTETGAPKSILRLIVDPPTGDSEILIQALDGQINILTAGGSVEVELNGAGVNIKPTLNVDGDLYVTDDAYITDNVTVGGTVILDSFLWVGYEVTGTSGSEIRWYAGDGADPRTDYYYMYTRSQDLDVWRMLSGDFPFAVKCAYIDSSAGWQAASQRAFKTKIETLGESDFEDFLEELDQLTLYRYERKDALGLEEVGVMAEEAPRLMLSGDQEGVNYTRAIGYLLGIVKGQQAQIRELQMSIGA